MATRPVLLHVLYSCKQAKSNASHEALDAIPENIRTLTETCINCARHSFALLTEAWADGSFHRFDSFKTQYLFASASILAASGLINPVDGPKDHEKFELACELLETLRDTGSFSAVEACWHFDAIRAEIQNSRSLLSQPPVSTRKITELDDEIQPSISEQPQTEYLTAGLTLAEPSLEAFLLQSEVDTTQADFWLHEARSDTLYWQYTSMA